MNNVEKPFGDKRLPVSVFCVIHGLRGVTVRVYTCIISCIKIENLGSKIENSTLHKSEKTLDKILKILELKNLYRKKKSNQFFRP